MNKIHHPSFLILFFIIACHSKVFSQWESLSIGITSDISDVYFHNKDTGSVVSLEKFITTKDGGLSWQTKIFNDIFLEGLYFINDSTGFLIGLDLNSSKSIVLKTTDRGNSWDTSLFNQGNLSDIHFPTPDTGYIVGSNGNAFRTMDRGNTWDTLITGMTDFINSVFFTDGLHGIIAGGVPSSPRIMETNDGGNTWSTIASPANSFLQGIFFPSELVGYIVGWEGEILKTVDGGQNWSAQTSVNNFGQLDVFFTDNNTGYVVGGEMFIASIQKTMDGGQTWYELPTFEVAGLIAVHFPNDSTGYIVGAEGIVLKTVNGGETGIRENKKELNISLHPNPAQNFLIVNDSHSELTGISIFDLQGKLLLKESNFTSRNTLDISFLSKGLYVVKVESKHQHKTIKMIKN